LLFSVFGGALLYCLIVFGLSDVGAEELMPFNTESWVFNPYNFVLLFAAQTRHAGLGLLRAVAFAGLVCFFKPQIRLAFKGLSLTATAGFLFRLGLLPENIGDRRVKLLARWRGRMRGFARVGVFRCVCVGLGRACWGGRIYIVFGRDAVIRIIAP